MIAPQLRTRTPLTLLVAVLVAGTVAACFSDATDPDDNGGTPAATVEMTDELVFDAREVTIQVGETVEWRNTGTFAHTVTADPELAADPDNVQLPDGAETFDSGEIGAGQTYRRTFTVPGRYDYVCLPHEASNMFGTVIVQE